MFAQKKILFALHSLSIHPQHNQSLNCLDELSLDRIVTRVCIVAAGIPAGEPPERDRAFGRVTQGMCSGLTYIRSLCIVYPATYPL